MKIAKEMLMTEHGFDAGVIIEWMYGDSKQSWHATFCGLADDENFYIYDESGNAEDFHLQRVALDDGMRAIRILTGPLAHWSLDMVPDDAEWSVVTAQGVDFFTAEDWKALEGIVLDAPGAVSKRPWWCERKAK